MVHDLQQGFERSRGSSQGVARPSDETGAAFLFREGMWKPMREQRPASRRQLNGGSFGVVFTPVNEFPIGSSSMSGSRGSGFGDA